MIGGGELAFAAFGVDMLKQQEERRASKATASELKKEAARLGEEARGRELIRRRELNKILSAQAAQFAGSGLMAVGSPAAIMQASAHEAQRDFQTDTANTQAQQKKLREQARQMAKARHRKAFIGTIGSAFDAYQSGGQ